MASRPDKHQIADRVTTARPHKPWVGHYQVRASCQIVLAMAICLIFWLMWPAILCSPGPGLASILSHLFMPPAGLASGLLCYSAFQVSPYLSPQLTGRYHKLSLRDRIDWDSRCYQLQDLLSGQSDVIPQAPHPRGSPMLLPLIRDDNSAQRGSVLCCRFASTLHALAITSFAAYIFFATDTYDDDTKNPEVWASHCSTMAMFVCHCLPGSSLPPLC